MSRLWSNMLIGVVCGVGLTLTSMIMAAERESKRTEPASLDEFEIRNLEGWGVYVNKQDLVDHRDEMDAALEHMRHQLYEVRLTVPAPAVAIMQERVPIWVEYDNERAATGFHPDFNWLLDRGFRPPAGLTSMVGICEAKNFCTMTLHQPSVMLHELAHGYDYLYLGRGEHYGNARIEAEFARAEQSGTYDSVICRYSENAKHYAMSNKMEYFAENTEAYFGTNDFYPFVRAELEEHDPDMYRLLQDLWGVDVKEQQRVTTSLVRFMDSQKQQVDTAAKGADIFHVPTSDYDRRQIEGWTVYVSPSLVQQQAYGDEMCKLVGHKLHLIKRYMPKTAVERLQQIPIWLEQHSTSVPYMTYHGSAEAFEPTNRNADKSHAIEIGNTERFRLWQHLQPFMLLNQLARAYYDQLPENKKTEIASGWRRAVDSGKYDSVLRFDGQHVRHPALTSPEEFFAEMTEAYYGVNDHYPFLQFETALHDPDTCKLLAKLWDGSAK